MLNLRAAVKLVRFLLSTWFYHSVILFGSLFPILGVDNKPWSTSVRYRWARSVIKILGMKLTVHGTPPKPPFFLVSNHLSYIDVWILFATADGTFITKSDVKDWPIAGFVLSTSGLIFVDRGRRSDVTRVNKEISEGLTSAQGIFLFPESTTSGGADVLPFKSSLFQYPASEGIEITSSAITYSSEDESVDVSTEICWWTDIPFPKHFWNVLKLKEFNATITFGEQKLVHSDRKYLANTTYSIVQQLFKPVKQPEIYAESTSSVTV